MLHKLPNPIVRIFPKTNGGDWDLIDFTLNPKKSKLSTFTNPNNDLEIDSIILNEYGNTYRIGYTKRREDKNGEIVPSINGSFKLARDEF